jgi:2-dehydro-3-deoxy-D-arabinonate dehydratase
MLFTGTGIVPPEEFTLQAGDEIDIHVPPIGTLTNIVAVD